MTNFTLLFCCVTVEVANRIVSSNEHLKTLVRCCDTSGHEGVRSEASRMLAVIVKQAKTAGNLITFTEFSRFGCLSNLLRLIGKKA